MIDTKHLRELIRRAVPLPWALATSNSYRRIVRADLYEEVCSPVKMPDGHPDLAFPGGPEGPTATLLIEAANALPELLDAMDAQTAEIAQLTAAQAWRPVETAPKDGSSVILRSRGGQTIRESLKVAQDRDAGLADTQRAIIEAAERRGYARAIAECAQEREDVERSVSDGIVDLAVEAYDHWDHDRDSKVGKILKAISGLLPGYDKRADAFHAARAAKGADHA